MAEKKGLIIRMADKFSLEPAKFMETLKGTIMKPGKDGKPVSDAEIAAFLVVADQYGLNPFTKEIYAFPDKRGGIIPVVGVDGWMRKISEHEQFNGMEIRWADTITDMPGGKPCPDWCEVVIYRKDREHPMVIREYLDEVYKTKEQNGGFSGPWQSHTKRFLRHKTIIQGGRAAFGLSGIYDEDEASRIVEQRERDMGEIPEVKKSATVKAKETPPEAKQEAAGEVKQPEVMEEGAEPVELINDGQRKMLFAVMKSKFVLESDLKSYLINECGIQSGSTKDIPKRMVNDIKAWLEKPREEAPEPGSDG